MTSRFSFNKNEPTFRGTSARIWPVFSFAASSSIKRKIERERDGKSRTIPVPLQRGQTCPEVSPKEGRKRWRDISIKPKREMRPTCTRARSISRAFFKRFSTSRWLRFECISMKSITTKPPMSRKRSWRAISSAASQFVVVAVSSMSAPLVARAELISIETSASVGSITIEPPDGNLTSRWKAVSIWLSI